MTANAFKNNSSYTCIDYMLTLSGILALTSALGHAT